MEKILNNGNKLVLVKNQANGSPAFGHRLNIYVAEIQQDTSFYRKNGKNVVKIHSHFNTIVWNNGTSPNYRYCLEDAEEEFNRLN